MKKKELMSLKQHEMKSEIHGFLSYPDSNNLGDYIQSIAAKELIDSNAVSLNREKLNHYRGPFLKLLMNGWFMENSKNWPPSDKIKPLMISFHINPIAMKNMLSPMGISYFKKHEPIGCRDLFTQKILSQNGINTYFSGCLTLTLKSKSNKNKREGILVLGAIDRMKPKLKFKNFLIDIFKFPIKFLEYKKARKRLNGFIKNQKDKKVIFKSQEIKSNAYSEKKKFILAQEQLDLISRSRIVITSRIHTALPAISLGTKVIFLTDGLDHINQSSRLDGLSDYFYCCKVKDLTNLTIEEIKPKKNHNIISKNLKEKVKIFFGGHH